MNIHAPWEKSVLLTQSSGAYLSKSCRRTVTSVLICSVSGHFTQCGGPVQRAAGDRKTNSSGSSQSLNSLVISAGPEHILQLLWRQVGDDRMPKIEMPLSQVFVSKSCFCFSGSLAKIQLSEGQVIVMGPPCLSLMTELSFWTANLYTKGKIFLLLLSKRFEHLLCATHYTSHRKYNQACDIIGPATV